MAKKYVCQAPYLRNYTSYDHHLWYTCVKWKYLQDFFFIFSKFWFSRLLGGKRAKTLAQNDNKFCLLHSISQELYIIVSSFMVHSCKTISPNVFFIFLKFWFCRLLGVKGQKMTQNNRFEFFILYISGSIDHIIKIFGTQV